MIIAVATENNMVAEHFGRCSHYTLFKLYGETISEEKKIVNPGHEPGFLPGYLAQMGVGCVIAGGMGQRARDLFAAENIDTCVGLRGPVRAVVDAYLDGTIEPGNSACDHPQGERGCC